MSEIFQISLEPEKKHKQGYVKNILQSIVSERLNTPLGYFILVSAAIFFAVVTALYGITPAFLLIVLFIGLPVLYAILAFPEFGVVVLLLMAYLLFAIMKFGIDFPVGTLMDALQWILVLGFFFRQKTEKNWKIFKGPVSVMILIWLLYNFIEVANPSAESRLAWVYTVRTVGVVMLMYFIFMFHIRTVIFIRFILKMWILLTLFAALYGLKQEYIGFSAGEEAYLHSDPNIMSLLFIDEHWRKFSIFSDPVAFSYNMAVSSLLCMALMTGAIKAWKKILLGVFIFIFLWSMLSSGTRGAYVLVPATLILFAVLKYNKQILLFSVGAGVFITVMIFIPTSNPTLYRFQSAFKPSDDASFNVRKANQKMIQPYILSHPLGGGLGATGAWGQRFAPNSFLAHFPPDSGYVRVAVEMGWVGLLLFCILMFIILKTGIKNYYRIRDPELKAYCLAMVLIVFAFNLGNYPQEALVQFPSNIYFYLVVALINITYRLDIEKNGPVYGGI
ncbi:O-antigen ligase family protein [Panacibacter ginsenosidivorans]|nr:O-antigen ligase family protein [Panacibacter ginsenosidivorans]